ncbi:glycosyltransferase, partial [Nioella ostreopsis]|uniref:glycosyltransferase n=1 Tax=Nioella ostreopsis TaxID=2448479 RepID=UPI00198129D6
IDTNAHAQNLDRVLVLLNEADEANAKHPVSVHAEVLSHCSITALRMSNSVLQSNPHIWEHLSRNLNKINPDHLIVIYDAINFWVCAPEDCRKLIVEELFSRPQITASACEKLINRLHANQPDDLLKLTDRLIDLAPRSEHGYLTLYAKSLVESADQALSQRKAYLPIHRKAKDAVLIIKLLRQAGRLSVATRFAKFLLLKNPNHEVFENHYVHMLLETGSVEQVEGILEKYLARGGRITVQKMAMVLNVLIQLDRLEDVDGICNSYPLLDNLPLGALNQVVRAKQSIGKKSEADRMLAAIKKRDLSTGTLHSAPTILQTIQVESSFDPNGEWENNSGRLTYGFTQIIRAAAGDFELPRDQRQIKPEKLIHQYWDKTQIPQEMVGLTESWRKDANYEYHLYDKKSARKILKEKLGLDWLKAFNNASSPAEESDFFRLCILMLRGGTYVDCDDRLVVNINDLYELLDGFTVFAEPFGYTANNFLACPKGHPLMVRAAIRAKLALENRHNENTLFKTGPGLLARTVASFLNAEDAGSGKNKVTVIPRYILCRYVQIHVPLPYKKTTKYWNSTKAVFVNDPIISQLRDNCHLPERSIAVS